MNIHCFLLYHKVTETVVATSYSAYSGIKTSGAIANIRNMEPIIAGLLGGLTGLDLEQV
ncbi:MAG TPA: hypothetical protein DCX22_01415 [Dehalococcoidia bacterium]|nr:hypothetical protein [Dehalococcoidia bacterium]